MKDYYTLPWTCEQSEKAQYVLRWLGLICFPILSIVGIYLLINLNILGLMFTLLGVVPTAMMWGAACIDGFIKFPEFRCKTKESQT